jgi:hypothetical protein
MPNGAKCRTARNPEQREIPNGAKCRTAKLRNGDNGANGDNAAPAAPPHNRYQPAGGR